MYIGMYILCCAWVFSKNMNSCVPVNIGIRTHNVVSNVIVMRRANHFKRDLLSCQSLAWTVVPIAHLCAWYSRANRSPEPSCQSLSFNVPQPLTCVPDIVVLIARQNRRANRSVSTCSNLVVLIAHRTRVSINRSSELPFVKPRHHVPGPTCVLPDSTLPALPGWSCQ